MPTRPFYARSPTIPASVRALWLKAWRTACERAGFIGKREGGITPHDLRHIAATDMRRAGIPESIII
ncbi:MAG: phage integrase family protein [Deltaproteobacteria bacterium]|nr:MAG: phage integrase family protein [Deltaproteobacteria bacterium]